MASLPALPHGGSPGHERRGHGRRPAWSAVLPNRWALLVAVIILACLTVNSGYRLEITNTGLKLEKGQQVVSFRLSGKELNSLNEACRRLGMNRTQVINAGVAVLLAEYVRDGGTLLRRAPWFLTSVTGGVDETD